MTKRDLYSNVLVKQAISPVNETGNTAHVSSIIDTKGFGSAMFVIAFGSLADAGCTITPTVHDGDNASLTDAAEVADSCLVGTEAKATVTQAADDSVRAIGYIGNKRYIRLTITPSGNAADAYMSAVCVLGHPLAAPVSQSES